MRATKLPIVMCHGLFGYDSLLLGPPALPLLELRYWSGIAETLRHHGATVYIARVPPTASIQDRAHELFKWLRRRGVADCNLVAHSMGGLDARFLITHLLNGGGGAGQGGGGVHVRSLTTISTPHRGSPFMNYLRDMLGLGLSSTPPPSSISSPPPPPPPPSSRSLSDSDKKALFQRLMAALDAPAYGNLTTEYLGQVFNPQTPDVPGVRYFSIGARLEFSPPSTLHHASPTSASTLAHGEPKEGFQQQQQQQQNAAMKAALRFPYEIVRRAEGDNDGFVSVYSARWGEYIQTVTADHFILTKYRGNRQLQQPESPSSSSSSPSSSSPSEHSAPSEPTDQTSPASLFPALGSLQAMRGLRMPTPSELTRLYQYLLPSISVDFGVSLDRLRGMTALLQKLLGQAVPTNLTGGFSVPTISIPALPSIPSLPSLPGRSSTSKGSGGGPEEGRHGYRVRGYQTRLDRVLDSLYGPSSFDDYVYGFDYFPQSTRGQVTESDDEDVMGGIGTSGSKGGAGFYYPVGSDAGMDQYGYNGGDSRGRPGGMWFREGEPFDTRLFYLYMMDHLASQGL